MNSFADVDPEWLDVHMNCPRWGDYCGCPLEILSSSRLVSLIEGGASEDPDFHREEWVTPKKDPLLYKAIRRELDNRGYGTKVIRKWLRTLPKDLGGLASEIIEAGYRQCAKRHHPDRGGSHDTMITLTEARDALIGVIDGEDY